MRSRAAALAGSAAHLVIAPGSIAVLVPLLISDWRFAGDFGNSAALRWAGFAAIVTGAAVLLESFFRFAWTGLGTPSPVAPTRRLIVTGLYRFVRNPIYVAAIAMILGQALWFGNLGLLVYAAAVAIAFHLFVIVYEEPTLRRQFPADYSIYLRHVGRWIPRLRPWRGAPG